jgi:GTP-binding protein
VNKVDNAMRRKMQLNLQPRFGSIILLLSISGSGTGDLLDALLLSQKPVVEEVSDLPRFAVVGRPNGKIKFYQCFNW